MNTKPFAIVNARRNSGAFTLVELLISVGVLALLILLVSQLMNSATAVTRTGSKHIDTDAHARAVLDRMALDFAKMLKRTDIDYYVKAPVGYKNPNAHGNGLKLKTGQQGNDQMDYLSQIRGYYHSGTQPPVSLLAYRVNSVKTSSPTYLRLKLKVYC